MKLRKRDLFLLVAAPALVLGAIGTIGGIQANEVIAGVAAGSYSLDDWNYNLVKDANTLNANDLVVFVNGSNVMSTTQNDNNRGRTTCTVTNEAITDFPSLNNVAVFKLSAGSVDNTFAFQDVVSDQYLYAASSSKNYLRSKNNIDGNASFSVTIATSGYAATLMANGSNSRKYLRWNSGNSIFSCYSSATSESPVYLYKLSQKVETPSETITISGNTSVNTGETITISANKSEGLSSNTLTWHSSNENAATIDENGVVTGVAGGTTTITATCEYNSETIKSNALTITVIDTTPTMTIDTNRSTIVLGRNNATVTLVDYTYCTPDSVSWSSTNTGVATVASNDVDNEISATVAPVAVGTTIIKATYNNGGNDVISNEIEITVSTYGEVTVNKSLSLTAAGLDLAGTYQPAGAKSTDNVSYQIENVAKVTKNSVPCFQIKNTDSLFCNLNPYSKDIYRIKVKMSTSGIVSVPKVYACDGLGKLGEEIAFNTNEARRTGTGYYEFDMSSKSTKYFAITGNGNNASYVEEVVVAFEADTYHANFDLEGGSMDADEIVKLPETKNTITLPTPTRVNYAFVGWSDGENTYEGGTQVTIYKDTSFTALWDNATILQDLVNGVEAKTALAYRCTTARVVSSNDGLIAGAKYIIGHKETADNKCALAGSLNSTYLSRVSAKVTDSIVGAVPTAADVFTLGETSDGWTLHTDAGYLQTTGAKSVGYTENAHAWSINIETNGDATINSVTEDLPLRYNSSSPRFTTYSSGQGAVRLYRVYETPVAPQFRIKVGVTAAIADLATTDGVTECGVEVTAGNTTKRFALSDLHTDDTGIRYATIDLGDIVNNYSRATTAFMVRAYVKSGEDYIYTTDAGKYKNLSVRDMVDEYHRMNEYKDIVDGLWSFFNAVSAY